jgi:hypothetical protein
MGGSRFRLLGDKWDSWLLEVGVVEVGGDSFV